MNLLVIIYDQRDRGQGSGLLIPRRFQLFDNGLQTKNGCEIK